MVITGFNVSGQNVDISIDGEYWAKIPYLIAFDFRLHKGDEISEEKLSELEVKVSEKKAFDYSLWYLSRYTATVKKMRQKLYEKEYKKPVVDSVISRLCELKYLDDLAVAESIVNQKSGKLGKNRLKAELKNKGISAEIISSVLDELDENDVFTSALNVAKKWFRSHTIDDYNDYQKFVRFMAYRGFDYDIIKKCKEVLNIGKDD